VNSFAPKHGSAPGIEVIAYIRQLFVYWCLTNEMMQQWAM